VSKKIRSFLETATEEGLSIKGEGRALSVPHWDGGVKKVKQGLFKGKEGLDQRGRQNRNLSRLCKKNLEKRPGTAAPALRGKGESLGSREGRKGGVCSRKGARGTWQKLGGEKGATSYMGKFFTTFSRQCNQVGLMAHAGGNKGHEQRKDISKHVRIKR